MLSTCDPSDLLAFGLSCGFAGFMLARVLNWLRRAILYRGELLEAFKRRRFGYVRYWLSLSFQWYDPYYGEPTGLNRIL